MKILDLPLEKIYHSQAFQIASPLVRGATFNVIMVCWQAGIFDLPDTETQFAKWAGCYSSQWYRIRNRVKEALKEILPALITLHAQESNKARKRQEKARKAGLASSKKRQLQAGLVNRQPANVSHTIQSDFSRGAGSNAISLPHNITPTNRKRFLSD